MTHPSRCGPWGFNPDDTLPKTFDLDRVEVLRGPQGTLFGAGSEGGTVRYILAQPKLNGSSTYMRSELSFTQGGAPSYEFGIAHGTALIDGTLGIRASAWFREDGGWINRVDPTTLAQTEKNANYSNSLNLRVAAVWQPVASLTFTPSAIYQNSLKHDESTYWPAYSNSGAGQFNNATPERQPVPDNFLLPALKIEVNLPHSQIISDSSYYYRKEQTAYQGTVYDLAYYQSVGWAGNPNTNAGNPPTVVGCADTGLVPGAPSGADPTLLNPACSWYPLIDANGLHLPPGFAGYATPNTVTNHQQTWTQEVRWQSTDDASRWRWTVGAFWQQSKEGSIEELKDTQINSMFQFLYGLNASDIFGDYYSCNGQGTYTAIPACDIYYNSNSTTDRQIAAFGELSYALTDKLRLTLGERIAHTSFTLQHYSDGLENFGPTPRTGAQQESPNTPKVNIAYQMDADNLFYATYAKGFRVGGGNAPLPGYCDSDLHSRGYLDGAPLTYKSDSTQSYEIGSKNSFSPNFKIASSAYYIQWRGIQQNIYIGGGCGLQFTDNEGTAVAKGFDLQAQLAAGPWKFDLATGYTDARYTQAACPPGGCSYGVLASVGDAISGEAALELSPGLNSPWTASVGVEFGFKAATYPAYVRLDYEYEGRNNWLSALQDPSSLQFNPKQGSLTVSSTYTLPSTVFASLRGGVTVDAWGFAAFVDNLFDSRTVTNYQLAQVDAYNPNPPTVQQNSYTFRPRTFGVTATYHH